MSPPIMRTLLDMWSCILAMICYSKTTGHVCRTVFDIVEKEALCEVASLSL